MARPRKNDAKAQGSLLTEKKAHEHEVPVKEQPYPLPDGWKWVRLISGFADCLDKFRKPINSTERAMREGAIPYYGATGQVGWINDYLTDEHLVLIGEDGAPFLDVIKNKAYIIEGKAWVNNHAHILRSFYGKNGNLYLMHYLNTFNYTGYVNGTTRLKLTQRNLNAIPIPLPPLGEQKRIVDRIESLFGKLDEAKEKTEAVLDGFETRKAAILHKAFTGELTAKWREDRGLTKESWQFLPFEKCISNMQNGISKRKGNSGRDYIVLRLTNLVNNKISIEEFNAITLDNDEIRKYSLNKNDILMIRVNGSKNNVGKQFMVEENNKYAFCDHIIRIKYDISKIDNKYAFLFSQGNYYKYYVQNNMVSSAGQNTISRKGLANLAIPLPTIPEQKEITRLLESLLEKEQQSKEAAETVLEQIDLMKKAILARAFRGELTGQVHNSK